MNTKAAARRRMTGWVGWIIFAAALMIVNGAFGAIQGLGALLRDEDYFVAVGGGDVLTFNITAWGWIHLILGLVLIAIGVLLIRGSVGGLILAIVAVGLHMIAQFTWIGLYPWWSLIAIALDIIILYALIVHGGELVGD
jgi:uncharacterized Tic20 family protein